MSHLTGTFALTPCPIILGFFGLGPLTVMVLVGGFFGNLDLPYPPEIIVLAVTSGSAISILLSPLIMPVITLSGANGLSGFKNGIRFNWKYALVLYVVVQIYVATDGFVVACRELTSLSQKIRSCFTS